MQGYEVVTHDDEKVVGRLVDNIGGYYIVERGLLRKTRHALPEAFAQFDEGGERLVISVPKELLDDSPEVDDDVNERAVAAHYGLADTTVEEAPGFDDSEVVEERIAAREGVEPTAGIRESPGMLGDRYEDTVVERDRDRGDER
jgi:hypothetical protein